ncbi:hypothetical protein A3H16_01515 [Candidatus Kaiserbacteria bacterium RIFCSPLOWO2_12_FULL_53_8]|uniref:Addiction module toxin RelE n=2 Tax=Candidatus Kaiseribacteriota TaxID=1752734 RepID=A0A1F6CW32_9BACT|nr:MAG: hypothetical protein A2851_00200 [Candidatus Kaiserbacteria bacterium RIFCSPHIGHO2_01_FULL_53_29]OGG91087.1 MAG: hypothetical protein A3H16_01515 [Candidatus Kaiserbacteria bacterium RIFCSPLOWO2_12_FULL_53_8]
MSGTARYSLVVADQYKRVLKKLCRKNPALVLEIERAVGKILYYPEFGKPLRHSLRNYRRVHIEGSFVLLYETQGTVVRLIDFDHHNQIYKKYS